TVIDNLNILDYDYYFSIIDSLLKEDTAGTLLLFDEILAKGFDGSHFISGLSEHFRNLLVSKDTTTLNLLEVSEGIKAKYLQQSQASSVSFLLSALNIANQCDLSYKLSKNQRLQVELALLKMCHLPSAFNMLTAPAAEMSVRQPAEQVKKKPDTSELSQPPTTKISGEVPVLNDQPAVYHTTKTPVIEKAPAQNANDPIVAEKPKQFIPNLHTASTSVKIPSLKNLGNATAADIAEEEDPYIKGDAKEDFTMDSFLKYWSDYAAKLKADRNMSLFTIFTANAPEMIEPYRFEVVVGNKSQENMFREEKPSLMNYLRVGLKNFSIEVNTKVDEIKASKRPYTNTEKYQYMASKNPQLAELRRRFNLDLD
ncbi:MAG: DNA polymerase III subunit gamma/tau, partial [Mucilaginibacter sp.]